MQTPVHKPPAKVAPVHKHEPPIPPLGREPSIIAFAVLRDGKDYIPTRLTLENGAIASSEPCGPAGIYESTAYEYLMAATMDHYRLKGLRR